MMNDVTMRFGRAVAVATLVILASVRSAGGGPLDPELEKVLEGLASQFSDGIATFIGGEAEHGKKGTSFEGKIVALFGLTSWGGGNGSQQFLAVFEEHQDLSAFPDGRRFKRYRLLAVVPVGDDSSRWFKAIELRKDRMILRGRRWQRADAHCCPSAEAIAGYRFSQRGLAETRP